MDLFKEIGKKACKSTSTPMDLSLKLGNADVMMDKEIYQFLLGISISKYHINPDFPYVVSLVSQFMHSRREVHLQPTLRVLQYLKGNPRRDIMFKRNVNATLEAYTDDDYTRSIIDRRSTTEYCNFLGGNM